MRKILFLLGVFLLVSGFGCGQMRGGGEKSKTEGDAAVAGLNIQVRASCSMIASKSQCLDYVGEQWSFESVKKMCDAEGLEPSEKPCPKSEIGGCRVGKGGKIDNIIWSYSTGGDPVAVADAKFYKEACETIQGAEWIGVGN